ncbi:Ectopic P granules protein 5 [Gryganskiella cystojenkinii]|nr:Ectopic P granules protein 5 [Gryganskiella cystojenkinii]
MAQGQGQSQERDLDLDLDKDQASIYPLLPSLPPLPSSRSYTFQPSAPPSAPPEHSPPSAPPTGSSLSPYSWHASSFNPSGPDLQPDRLFSEPSAPSFYPDIYPNEHVPYPHHALNAAHASPSTSNHQQQPQYEPDEIAYPRLKYNLTSLSSDHLLTNTQLQETYQNEFLNNLPQRLARIEHSSGTTPQDSEMGAFVTKMRSYETAYESVQQCRLALFNLEQKAKGYARKLWTVQSKSEVAKASCGDGATISHTYTYQYGHHEPEVALKLQKSLNRLFKQRTKHLVRMQFEETSCKLWIQDHLSSYLRVLKETGQCQEIDLQRITGYLDVLFGFERSARRQPDFDPLVEGNTGDKTSSPAPSNSILEQAGPEDGTDAPTNAILRSMQDWITLMAASLLHFGSFKESEYLIVQVLRSRRISKWAVSLIQCSVPTNWSVGYQEFYLTTLQLVLCGTSTPFSRLSSALESTTDLGQSSLGSGLDEDDYLAILDQVDVTLFFNRLLLEHKDMFNQGGTLFQTDVSNRTTLRLFAATRHFFDVLLHGLQVLIKFSVASRRVAQMLCQLAQIFGDHLLVLGPMSKNAQYSISYSATRQVTQLVIMIKVRCICRSQSDSNSDHITYRTTAMNIQSELDYVFSEILRSILALPGHGLWTFLPSIPFQYMSTDRVSLFIGEIALQNIQDRINNPASLLSMELDENKMRLTLGKNPGEALFLITALAHMVTSRKFSHARPEEPWDMTENSLSLEERLAMVITFLVLDVAYIDSDIRGELSKPTREVLGSMCDSHPRIVSFILKFVERHFKEIGSVAEYVFRVLPLGDWEMTRSDFNILTGLLETSPLNSAESLFARSVFIAIPWSKAAVTKHGVSNSQKTVMGRFKIELALAMADICSKNLGSTSTSTSNTNSQVDNVLFAKDSQQNKPSPTSSPSSSSSTVRIKSPEHKSTPSFASSLPHAITNLAAHSGLQLLTTDQVTMKAFMDWCWKLVVELELTELEPLTLVESSRLNVSDPGLAKYPMFSQGQLTFVNTIRLLLTEASRDSEQFLKDGWATLSAVLQTGMGSALLHLVAVLVPPLMASSDKAAHATKFGALLREVASWKQDPMLSEAGMKMAEGQQGVNLSKTAKESIAFWVLLQRHIDLRTALAATSTDFSKDTIQFWITAITSQKDWMAHQDCVQIMDVICHACFELGLDTFIKDLLTEQQILLSIGFRRAPGMSAELMGLAQPGLDKVMDLLPDRLTKALPVPQGSNDPSLLMGTWSVRTFATHLWTQQAMVESSSIWFAYYALLVETSLEKDMRIKIGHYYRQHSPAPPSSSKDANSKALQASVNIKTVMKTLGITNRKTLHNFAIWRWAQHLLILPLETPLLPLFWQMFFYLYFGHTEQRGLFYGHKFLEDQPEIVDQLRDRLLKTCTYFGQEARKAIQGLDLNAAEKLTTLHEFYNALHGWIREPLLLSSEIDLKRIRKDFLVERLVSCRLPDPLECSPDLWKDLLLLNQAPSTASVSSPKPSSLVSIHSPATSPKKGGHLDYDHSRAARKHGQAWQDQKIGNCLVKLSKPAPDMYIPRALLPPPAIDYTYASPQSLFGSATRSIQGYGKGYRDTSAAHQNLDDLYLKELGALYHNEVKISKLEVACDTTPNALCKRPAVIELQYETIVLNEGVQRSIVENRERARALRLGHAEQGLCLAALEISKTVDTLMRTISPDENQGGAAAVGKVTKLAVESFYFLLQELLEDARNYPPALIVLTSLVQTLGMTVVAKDPAQTEPILDRMKATDDFAISLLVETFYPASTRPSSEFVRLYERIATCKEYSLASKDRLLRQFDVQAWAVDPTCSSSSTSTSLSPTVQDRLSFYKVAFTAMVAQQQLQRQDDQIQEATEISTRDRLAIIKSHRELAGTLFLNFLQQDYIEYLRILFDTCAIMCLEPEVLEDFIRIMGVEPRYVPVLLDGADVAAGSLTEGGSGGGRGRGNGSNGGVDLGGRTTRIGLSDYDFEYLVRFLGDYFRDVQDRMMARGNLLDRYSGYAVSIASLLTVVLCDERYFNKWFYTLSGPSSLGEPSSILAGSRLWRDIQILFRPWFTCLTNRASDETRFQRQQGGASRLLFVFVGLVSKLMTAVEQNHYYGSTNHGAQTHDNQLVSKVFEFYLDLILESSRPRQDQQQQQQQQQRAALNINQIMVLHQQFHRLPWKGLRLSRVTVDRIVEIQATLPSEIRIEFWTYLITIVMEKAESDMRPVQRPQQQGSEAGMFLGYKQTLHVDEDEHQWRQNEISFLKLGLAALQEVETVVGDDSELRHQVLARLWRTIFETGSPWDWLLTSDLQGLVKSLTTQWDRVGTWDDVTSPMGRVLYWMRVAVGLEESNMADDVGDDDGEDDPRAPKPKVTHKDLDPQRVLIYFGYVLQLLQTRLSSSAQDSQNKNFAMTAIPSVVAHLGQVLDNIAGDPNEARHPVIHRPLLTLVGILNKCGGNPKGMETQLTLSGLTVSGASSSVEFRLPATSQPFSMVLLGLQQMISTLEVIQLDLVRALSQRLNSVPAMILLLEGSIEREFELWGFEHQERSLSSSLATVSGGGGGGGLSGSVFGLEETTLQSMSPIPHLGHMRTFSGQGSGLSSASVAIEDLQGQSQQRRQSWKKIQSQLETPELSEDEFLEEGQRMGAVLTLHGRYLQLLEGSSAPAGVDEDEEELDGIQTFDEILELGQELAEVISKVDLLTAENAPEEEIEKKRHKAYQSLLLVRMFLTMVAKESVHSVLQSRFLSSVMQVCRTLETWCQDSRDWSKKSMLSSLGIGSTSRSRTLDPRFRLVVRIIYTYLVVRLADKGLSIHQNAAGGGSVLAWRKGRQQSIDVSGATSPLSSMSKFSSSSGKDASSVLIETLVQLPAKNKDYAAIFVKSATSSSSASLVMPSRPSPGPGEAVTAAAATVASAAMAIPVRLIASSVSLSSSLSMSPQPSTSMMASSPTGSSLSSSPPLRSWSSSVPTVPGGNFNHHTSQKRMSMQSQHSSRLSISSWDESSGAIFKLEEESGGSGGGGSHFNQLLPPLPPSTPRRLDRERQRARKLSLQNQAQQQHRQQQQTKGQGGPDGTKNGLADLEWAVEQIRDRRFRILEAAEILTEVLDRFYERDVFFV